MKRLIALLVTAIMLMGTLAACNNPAGSSSAPPNTTKASEEATKESETDPAPEIEPCTITFWSGDRHDMEYIQKHIDKFNKENKYGITVEAQFLTDDLETMYKLAYETGDAPDVIGGSNKTVETYGGAYLLNLEPLAAADPTYSKEMEIETRKYAYKNWDPALNEVYCYYGAIRTGTRAEYNIELVKAAGYEELPTKLSDYIDMAKKITAAGNGEYYGIGFTSSSPFERFCEQVAMNSGITWCYDYKNGKFDFSGYKEIIEECKRFIAEEIAYPDQQGVDNMRALFAEGEFALWQNASQEIGVFTEQIPIKDFEWGVGALPTLTGEVKGALDCMVQKGYCITKTSEHVDAAWEFIKYMQSLDVLVGYCEAGYSAPLTNAVRDKYDASKAGRMGEFQGAAYDEVYPSYPSVNLTGDNYRKTLWEAVMGNVDVDEAIADCNKRYNDALEADIKSGDVLRVVIPDFDPMHPNDGTIEYRNE